MRVRNRMDIELESCRCGSWLQHWDSFSRQKANFCMVLGCDNKPEVGGLVQKAGEDKLYIVPLCRACAAKTGEELDIVVTVNLVPTQAEGTCARRQAS
jgi:hypothetical protein